MQQIWNTIRTHRMIEPGMRVLVGVSGGADSLCLLTALSEYRMECPFDLFAVHVEHGIRGQESLEDAAYVQQFCADRKIPCRVVSCDAIVHAREHGQSLEEAARELRYRIFRQVREELSCDVIAVAHNENDQAETVLWNLVRGTSLRGLCGIHPVRDGIIRPLLYTSRSRIEEILTQREITWRNDRTNQEREYTRNRLRLDILPEMEEHLNRKAVRHIAACASQMQEASSFLNREVEKAAKQILKITDTSIEIELKGWKKADSFLQGEVFRYALAQIRDAGLKDVGRKHIDQLRALAEMPCGRETDLPGNVTAVRERDLIVLRRSVQQPATVRRLENTGAEPPQADSTVESYPLAGRSELHLPGKTVKIEQYPAENIPKSEILSEKKYTKWFPCDTIKGGVCFRKRQPGDYLIVNAAGGRKKLKDYFIDLKIPRRERDDLWLLADGSHVLWVAGYRISEAAKVTETTEQVIRITIIDDEEENYERESQNLSV